MRLQEDDITESIDQDHLSGSAVADRSPMLEISNAVVAPLQGGVRPRTDQGTRPIRRPGHAGGDPREQPDRR